MIEGDGEATVPCTTCGKATTMTGTKLCDGCWQLRRDFDALRERSPGAALTWLGAQVERLLGVRMHFRQEVHGVRLHDLEDLRGEGGVVSGWLPGRVSDVATADAVVCVAAEGRRESMEAAGAPCSRCGGKDPGGRTLVGDGVAVCGRCLGEARRALEGGPFAPAIEGQVRETLRDIIARQPVPLPSEVVAAMYRTRGGFHAVAPLMEHGRDLQAEMRVGRELVRLAGAVQATLEALGYTARATVVHDSIDLYVEAIAQDITPAGIEAEIGRSLWEAGIPADVKLTSWDPGRGGPGAPRLGVARGRVLPRAQLLELGAYAGRTVAGSPAPLRPPEPRVVSIDWVELERRMQREGQPAPRVVVVDDAATRREGGAAVAQAVLGGVAVEVVDRPRGDDLDVDEVDADLEAEGRAAADVLDRAEGERSLTDCDDEGSDDGEG